MSKTLFWLTLLVVVGLLETYYNRSATSGFLTLTVLTLLLCWLVLNTSHAEFWLTLIAVGIIIGGLSLNGFWLALIILVATLLLQLLHQKLLNTSKEMRFVILGNAFLLGLGIIGSIAWQWEITSAAPLAFLAKSWLLYNLILLLNYGWHTLNAKLFHQKNF